MSDVLIDSGVWIQHFRVANEQLLSLVEKYRSNQINLRQHDMVIGELMLGGIPDKENTLMLLKTFSFLPLTTPSEFKVFIDSNNIVGTGIGYVDASILASCKLEGCKLWTLDLRLREQALKLGLFWEENQYSKEM